MMYACTRSGGEPNTTDDGYLGEIASQALEEQSVELKTSEIKGKPKSNDTTGFEEFIVERGDDQTVTALGCPKGTKADVRPGRKPGYYSAAFDAAECAVRPFAGHRCKMPVRGKSRITTMTVLSVLMVNVRRIMHYYIM
jgi:hypothetical protein